MTGARHLSASGLGTVQQTLLTPLYARAREANQAKPILMDLTAQQLVADIDHDFGPIAKFPDTLTGCAIRASIMDDWIKQWLNVHPTGQVVLIGEGLDTTFDRNDNGKAQWMEVDFPDVIRLRRDWFPANNRRMTHSITAESFDWMDDVPANRPAYLFQLAGVTMYLEPTVVEALFTQIADRFPSSTILFDTTSTLGVRNSAKWECTVRTTEAQYRFGMDDPHQIERWHDRLKVIDVESMMNHRRDRWSWRVRLATTFWRRLRYSYLINRAVVQH